MEEISTGKKNSATTKFGGENFEQSCGDSSSSEEEELSLQLTQISNYQDPNPIRSIIFHIAFKTPTSCAFTTSNYRLEVIEDNIKICSNPNPLRLVIDIVYIDCLKCYLLVGKSAIFRKDIDGKPPYIFIDNFYLSHSIRYSKMNQRLFCVAGVATVKILNLIRKQMELEIVVGKNFIQEIVVGTTFVHEITDLMVLGENERKIIFVSNKGYLVLCTVCFELRKVCRKFIHSIENIRGRKEVWRCLAVCDENKYILAHSSMVFSDRGSRMMLFQAKSHSLVHLATINEEPLNFEYKRSIEFFRCIGEEKIWAGISRYNGYLFVYDFDPESGDFYEMTDYRTKNKELKVRRIDRFVERLYFSAHYGKIMELSFTSNQK